MNVPSVKDSNILALVVEHPHMSESRFQALFDQITDDYIRRLAGVYHAHDRGRRVVGMAPEITAMVTWRIANRGRSC